MGELKDAQDVRDELALVRELTLGLTLDFEVADSAVDDPYSGLNEFQD